MGTIPIAEQKRRAVKILDRAKANTSRAIAMLEDRDLRDRVSAIDQALFELIEECNGNSQAS